MVWPRDSQDAHIFAISVPICCDLGNPPFVSNFPVEKTRELSNADGNRLVTRVGQHGQYLYSIRCRYVFF